MSIEPHRAASRRRAGRVSRVVALGVVTALASPAVFRLAVPEPRPAVCPALTISVAGVSLHMTLRYPAGCRSSDD